MTMVFALVHPERRHDRSLPVRGRRSVDVRHDTRCQEIWRLHGPYLVDLASLVLDRSRGARAVEVCIARYARGAGRDRWPDDRDALTRLLVRGLTDLGAVALCNVDPERLPAAMRWLNEAVVLQRTVIALCLVLGCTDADAARVLRIAPATVAALLRSADGDVREDVLS